MTRGKVKLEYISDDVVRRATFKKRRKGMMKKLKDLTTLCGVEACAIVYESKSNNSQPEIWPSQMGVQRVLSKFYGLSKIDRTKKMLDQRSYLKERISKAKEQLMKTRRANREKEMTLRMNEFVQIGKLPENLSLVDLNDLAYAIDKKMWEIEKQVEKLKKEDEQRIKKMMMTKGFASSSSFVPALEERNKCVFVEDGNGFQDDF